jgi:hypothetical protein
MSNLANSDQTKQFFDKRVFHVCKTEALTHPRLYVMEKRRVKPSHDTCGDFFFLDILDIRFRNSPHLEDPQMLFSNFVSAS